jgi:hypothetical protein
LIAHFYNLEPIQSTEVKSILLTFESTLQVLAKAEADKVELQAAADKDEAEIIELQAAVDKAEEEQTDHNEKNRCEEGLFESMCIEDMGSSA